MTQLAAALGTISPKAIAALHQQEAEAFLARRPQSCALFEQAQAHLPGGVPMHWMRDWGTPVPLVIDSARGITLTDIDGNHYRDFCLGDTGAMFGHSPAPVQRVLRDHAGDGLTAMLPGADAAVVAAHLAERFGLPYWQVTATATDANRALLRWARAIATLTDAKKDKVLVFNGCYHGTVEETMVQLHDGRTVNRPGLIGQIFNLSDSTVAIEFNDRAALSAALARGDIVVLLAEPVMTNCGMVLPDEGYWAFAQAECKKYGVLLAIDETHCISSGWAGYTGTHQLQPDFLVLGKPIAGGLCAAVYGFTAEVFAAMNRVRDQREPGHSGMGTTLAANLLTLRAMRAMLSDVMSHEAYAHMLPLAEYLADGLRALFGRHQLPWSIAQVGARCEWIFAPTVPRTGAEALAREDDHDLGAALHLALLNRGVLVTPFHHMCLVSPQTQRADIDALLNALDDCLLLLKHLSQPAG
ncbi:transaminase [Permianibacter fluminis]|uniref:transaminase n=1 Tax=Permianibacter fluminis TaxID=2738515 RepID=UPI002E2C8DD7|nr:transaminase [Permianibacter fluminis]